jgi:hypothetical protein
VLLKYYSHSYKREKESRKKKEEKARRRSKLPEGGKIFLL